MMSRDQRMLHQRRVRFSHVKADLDSEEVRALLSELCVTLGFRLPQPEIERLVASHPNDSDEFTEAVLSADGYGIEKSEILQEARELVAKAFLRHQGQA
jgi:hypothetical protein